MIAHHYSSNYWKFIQFKVIAKRECVQRSGCLKKWTCISKKRFWKALIRGSLHLFFTTLDFQLIDDVFKHRTKLWANIIFVLAMKRNTTSQHWTTDWGVNRRAQEMTAVRLPHTDHTHSSANSNCLCDLGHMEENSSSSWPWFIMCLFYHLQMRLRRWWIIWAHLVT